VSTHIFKASLEKDEDDRWSAWIDILPGCAAWGYGKEDAMRALKDAAEAYIQDMIEAGEEIPQDPTATELLVVTIDR